jgi:hypothetical protein
MVLSSQDFGVEQFFRADDFRADDPSPFQVPNKFDFDLKHKLPFVKVLSHKNKKKFLPASLS